VNTSSFIPQPSSFLFAYPPQSEFNHVLPKSKIYAHARPSRAVRDRFVREVEQIVWKYKLAPETINLPARPGVPEIQVFGVSLRTDELSEAVLRTIDKAISFPIIYELEHGGRIRSLAVYKRPSDADSTKWVVEGYFATEWRKVASAREPLPVALDLAQLYEQLLRRHIAVPARSGESLKQHVQRVITIRGKEVESHKLKASLRQERQFNRKVELNRTLRTLNEELKRLSDPRITQNVAD
jgi:hypothetical protein